VQTHNRLLRPSTHHLKHWLVDGPFVHPGHFLLYGPLELRTNRGQRADLFGDFNAQIDAFGLGRAYRSAGDDAKARAEFDRALQLDPNNKRAQDALKSLSQPQAKLE